MGSHEQGANLPQRRQCILPLRGRQLSLRCVTPSSEWKRRAAAKKDFETDHSGVFAAPGSLLAHFSTAESGLNRSSRSIVDDERKPNGLFVERQSCDAPVNLGHYLIVFRRVDAAESPLELGLRHELWQILRRGHEIFFVNSCAMPLLQLSS
jgi:hypothetical protein